MYRLTSHIEIGTSPAKLVFDYVSQVNTVSAMGSLTDTCSITLPRNLNLKDKNIRELIKQGDPVAVDLGYNDDNKRVFDGYVKQVKPGAPVMIECEDAMYQLKRIRVKNETIESFDLKKFLKQYMPADIKMDVGDVKLGQIRIEKEPSLAQVLTKLKDEYYLQFFFREGVFYGVLPSTRVAMTGITTHNLKFGWNIISDNLQYKAEDDVRIIVKAKAILKDNTKLEATEPEGETEGTTLSYFSDSATTEAELRKFAKEMIAGHKPEGATGSLTLFGIPYILPGDRVKLTDVNNKERDGKTFLVKSVKRSFGTGGYRQEIELGELISDGN